MLKLITQLSSDKIIFGGLTLISLVLAVSFISLLRYVFSLVFNHISHNTKVLTELTENVRQNTEFTKEACDLLKKINGQI